MNSDEEEEDENEREVEEATTSVVTKHQAYREQQLFVPFSGKKAHKIKKSRSLPASFELLVLLQFSASLDMVLAISQNPHNRRGYFYESVGGVYYTSEWPLRSSSGDVIEAEMTVPNVLCDADSGTHSMPHLEIGYAIRQHVDHHQKTQAKSCKGTISVVAHEVLYLR